MGGQQLQLQGPEGNWGRGRRRRMRKGMFLLPSLFTSFNVAAGFYVLLHCMQVIPGEWWRLDRAAWAIGIAFLFDGIDGRIARMTNTTSDFGRELDSLADVITFGVAPALLAWTWGFRLLPNTAPSAIAPYVTRLGAAAGFLFLIAGASRLARFNIQINPQPSNPGRPGKKYFVGMPIPAAAALVAAAVHFNNGQPLPFWWAALIWAALLLALAFLMVSTWRFYSFKEFDFRSRHRVSILFVMAALVALVWFFSQYVLFAMALGYMVSGVLLRMRWIFRRRTSPPSAPYTEAQQLQ
jgi:CDP-diacylglycerol--serine O-phosphatidyltransferase